MVCYIIVFDLILGVKDMFGWKGKSEFEVYESLYVLDLLVIDEVGVQYGIDFECQVLFQVVNGCYECLFLIILISNLSLVDIW